MTAHELAAWLDHMPNGANDIPKKAAAELRRLAKLDEARPLHVDSIEEDYHAWRYSNASTWDAFLAGVRLAEDAHGVKWKDEEKWRDIGSLKD